MSDPAFNTDQAAALKTLRLRWLAALLVNAPLPFFALPITGSGWLEQQPGGEVTQSMLLAALIGIGSVLGGIYARNQAHKAHWRGDVVEPAGFIKGGTIFFAAVTAAAYALFVISLITGYPAPTFAAAPIIIGLLALNFPSGKPMRPAPPRIGEDGALR